MTRRNRFQAHPQTVSGVSCLTELAGIVLFAAFFLAVVFAMSALG